jgi:Concanavalin A-like lectin/glucanases superfamily
MPARRVWSVALVGTSACFPSFEGLSGPSIQGDSSAGAEEDGGLIAADAVSKTDNGAADASGDGDAPPTTDAPDAADGPQDTPFPLPPDAPSLGLYFYWPFESASTKAAEDVSGNHRNGTLTSVSNSTDQAPTTRPGNVRSVKFEMAQSSISCLADVPVESYTIAMWVKPTARSSVLVVSREDSTSSDLLMQLRVTGNGVFEHYVNDGSSGAGCQNEVGSCITGTTVIKGGTWYHVAVSAKSRGEMHLYVNGFEEGTSRTLMQFQNPGARYDFGYEAGRSTGGFQGVVDEIIVYDWVLPATAVNKVAAPM